MSVEEIESTQVDINKYGALASVGATEGGQELLKSLTEEIRTAVDNLANNYTSMPESEMRALGAKLSVCLGLVRALNRAADNYADATSYLKTLTQ